MGHPAATLPSRARLAMLSGRWPRSRVAPRARSSAA
jgi:hypothetical protein